MHKEHSHEHEHHHHDHHHDHEHDHDHSHEHEHHHHHHGPKIKSFHEVVEFHGHTCPGLTIGYRAAETAIKELSAERDIDEELVAIVENDACGVDAIQVVTGCTVGKGNLIFKDHGKNVYTFIDRKNDKAVRIALKDTFSVDEIDPEMGRLRSKVMSGEADESEKYQFERRKEGVCIRIMGLPAERLFDIKHVEAEVPKKAMIFKSVKCSKCGEMVSESRARVQDGGFVCIPCFEEYTRGW